MDISTKRVLRMANAAELLPPGHRVSARRTQRHKVSFVAPVEGEEEQRRFDEGKERYLQNKARRTADRDVQP
ncbi:unnamed protein product [Merluccius merluccius]